MKIALIGYGRMGQMVGECIGEQADMEVSGIVEPGHLPSLSAVQSADVAIDLSYPGDFEDVLSSALAKGMPLVIGRTGLSEAQGQAIREAARQIPIVWASNFSVGVTVMVRMARMMAQALGDGFDIEIVEAHHKKKLDAPSGTAKMLLAAVDPSGAHPVLYGREGMADAHHGEIGVHVLRGGTVAGEHHVHFYGDMEELTLSHRADSRRTFAVGAVKALRFAAQSPAGLYNMEDVLFGGTEGGTC